MKVSKTKIAVIVLISSISAFAINKIVKNSQYKKLMDKITGGVSERIEDFKQYFSGTSYLISVTKKIGAYIMLADFKVTEYRTSLYDAISGAGTDEDIIFKVFNNLRDGVQIAQISKSYQSHYNENLFDALMGDLSESDLKKLSSIISLKPPYRKA